MGKCNMIIEREIVFLNVTSYHPKSGPGELAAATKANPARQGGNSVPTKIREFDKPSLAIGRLLTSEAQH